MKKHLFFILILVTNVIIAQQSNIKVKFNNTKDTTAVLGYYYGNEKYIEDTTSINEKGEAVFSNKNKYTGGMYFVALPQSENIYFTLLIGNNQDFTVETSVENNQFIKTKFINSDLNIAFEKFNDDMNKMNVEYQKLAKQYSEKDIDKVKKDEIKESLKLLKQKRKNYILETYNNEKFSTLKKIIGFIIEPEMPDFKINADVKNKDSLMQMKKYYYYKNHYWDYVDFNDSTIIRTAFFIPKFEKYIKDIVLQNPDSIIYESVKLIEKSKSNIAVFAYMVNYMLVYNEKSKFMGMDKIFVEIGKRYYLTGQAVWSDSAYTAKVIEKVYKTEPNLIGQRAPALNNVMSIDDKELNMYDVDAKYLIIIFWEPSCGHCKTELPNLYNYYNELIKDGVDLEVFAMLGDKDTVKWKNFIKEHKLTNWINVWDKNWETNFKIFYDVYSTPTIYVLDENKKIIAKRINSEQVRDIIKAKEFIKE